MAAELAVIARMGAMSLAICRDLREFHQVLREAAWDLAATQASLLPFSTS